MANEIITVAGFAQREIVVKKSRFIGLVWPLASEEEAAALLQKSKLEYPGATHYVYAYVLGADGQLARLSDDGEPGGTAGKPVLSAIRLQNLTNTLVVVIRYFGGILLGAPGLVRAYSQAAREALAAAGSKSLQPTVLIQITVSYQLLEPIRYQLEKLGAEFAQIQYQSEVTLDFFLPQGQMAAAQKLLVEYKVPLVVLEEQLYR